MKVSNFAIGSRSMAVAQYMMENDASDEETAIAFGCSVKKIKQDISNLKRLDLRRWAKLISKETPIKNKKKQQEKKKEEKEVNSKSQKILFG